MRYNDILKDEQLKDYVRQINQRAKSLGHRGIGLDAIRDRILESQGRCEWCHTPLTGIDFELDHIQSLHHKGAHNADNLVVACQRCNRRKGAKPPIQFALEIVAETGIKTRIVQILLKAYDTEAPVQRSLFDDDASPDNTSSDNAIDETTPPESSSTQYRW